MGGSGVSVFTGVRPYWEAEIYHKSRGGTRSISSRGKGAAA